MRKQGFNKTESGKFITKEVQEVQDILTSWVHPKLTARENIKYTRDPIYKPGFILKIVDGIDAKLMTETHCRCRAQVTKPFKFGIIFNSLCMFPGYLPHFIRVSNFNPFASQDGNGFDVF